ncbi:MAG TPA: hypothetical protein VJ998_07965, partial [Pseudomonadales bacterium]|nr:hypothetical protein [Pseudomonadales bacterium]
MRSIYLIVVSMFLSAAYAAEPAPATTQSLADQARALAGLADTAERQGITLPPGLFPGISAALSINANYPPAQRQALAASLADFSDQLRQEMSRPGMLGRTSIAVLGGNSPIAGGAISVRQQYTVGTTLGPGAAIMVAKHWMEPSPLQTDNAGGNDYVSVSAKSGVSFSARTMPRRGIYGGRYAEEPVPVFDVASGQIEQGTTITITYSRLRLPNRATDDFPLPVYVRLTSDGPFLAVPISGIPVQPGKLDKLSLYAPNVARTGQSFTVHAMLTDRFGNPVNGALPPLDLLVDGVIEQSIPGAADASPEIPLTLATAGLHQLELRSAGGGLVADARVDVEDTPGWTIRWVELHAHTRLSDGLQSADEVRQRLSGVVDDLFLVDHDNEMSDAAWRSRPAQTLDGFEWSGDIRSGGHRIVLSSTRFAFDRSPRLEFPTDADLT